MFIHENLIRIFDVFSTPLSMVRLEGLSELSHDLRESHDSPEWWVNGGGGELQPFVSVDQCSVSLELDGFFEELSLFSCASFVPCPGFLYFPWSICVWVIFDCYSSHYCSFSTGYDKSGHIVFSLNGVFWVDHQSFYGVKRLVIGGDIMVLEKMLEVS